MRGSVVSRGENAWLLRYDDPAAPVGARKQVNETIHGTRKDADRILRERLANIDKGLPVDTGKITVEEWLTTWLRDIVAVRNKPRTVESYQVIVRVHLIPGIGHIRLVKLSATDVGKMYAAITKLGRTDNTVHHVHVVLSKAIKDAMRRNLVYRNVCQLVDAPTPGRYEVDAPDASHIARILAQAQSDPYYAAFHVMAYTGIRRGEAIALKWTGIDLERSILSVTEAAGRIKGKGMSSDTPKSAASRRGIALDSETVRVLKTYRARQAAYRLKIGSLFEDNDLVFPGPYGKLLDPNVLSHRFEKIRNAIKCEKCGHKWSPMKAAPMYACPKCEAAVRASGLAHVRLHDLRHGHAGVLIAQDIHPKVVQERLGHATAAFTMQVYGHVAAGMQAKAADAFAKAMDGK